MRRPFYVERRKVEDSLVGRGWWETEIASLSDEEVHARSIADRHRRPGDEVPEGEAFLVKAASIGVNAGGLWRALYASWAEHGGYTVPFDTCTWEQALEYAHKALPDGTDATRHEWAIRYMWCLELPGAEARSERMA